MLRGLSTNKTKKRNKIIKALIKLSFAIYFKYNISSKVTIIHFIK